MDRADMDYWKFEDMTKRGVSYITKIKKDLTYKTLSSIFHINERRQMVVREEIVRFSKKIRVKSDDNDEEKEETIEHKARIITYAAEKNSGKKKHWEITRLLTNFRLNLLVFNRFRQKIYVYRTLIILSTHAPQCQSTKNIGILAFGKLRQQSIDVFEAIAITQIAVNTIEMMSLYG